MTPRSLSRLLNKNSLVFRFQCKKGKYQTDCHLYLIFSLPQSYLIELMDSVNMLSYGSISEDYSNFRTLGYTKQQATPSFTTKDFSWGNNSEFKQIKQGLRALREFFPDS